MDSTLALDIGGTKITAGLVCQSQDAPATVTHRITVSTPHMEGADAVLAAAGRALDAVRAQASETAPRALGIATAGVVEPKTGRISHATDAIRGWAGIPLGDLLAERTGLPVTVLNDVQAHALGEHVHRRAPRTQSLLLVAVGTGIGAGIVVDGAVQDGAHGAAGHIGHVPSAEAAGLPCPCGRSGHLEGLASGPGILALAARLGAPASALQSGPALAAAAAAGDEQARRAYRIAGRATGRVIGGALNLLDIDRVAITGGVASAFDEWFDELEQGARAEAMDVVAHTPIRPAEAGTNAALIGAAQHVRNSL